MCPRCRWLSGFAGPTRGCGRSWRPRTPRSRRCGLRRTPRTPSCGRWWRGRGCGSPSWNVGWGWAATIRGTPSSKESIQAKAARKAQRRARDKDVSSRERSPDRERGGQPGHEGHGLARELDPDRVEPVAPPTRCRGCGAGLGGAVDAGAGWSQTWDVEIVRRRVEYRLPRRRCACGVTTTAGPPEGQAGSICYGPRLNGAAIVLSAFGNVPTQRVASVIGMLFGVAVSPGFVDRANTRLSQRLAAAGFDAAM